MTNPDELAGLPEDVREAIAICDRDIPEIAGNGYPTAWGHVRAELLRLTRERDDLRESILGLRAMREDIEAELAALKRRIAEATLATVLWNNDLGWHTIGAPPSLEGQRVALLPVGGETK